MQPETLQQDLADFIAYRRNLLTGDEKGEAQVFLDRMFKAFGHGGVREAGATLEARVRNAESRGTSFADLLWESRCIIEMKKAGTDLSKHFRQAFQYWIQVVPHRPNWVSPLGWWVLGPEVDRVRAVPGVSLRVRGWAIA